MQRRLCSNSILKYWLSHNRRLADPTLEADDSMLDGSFSEVFWCALIDNRETSLNYKSPNLRPWALLAIIFGYWYLLRKPERTKRWQDDFFTY